MKKHIQHFITLFFLLASLSLNAQLDGGAFNITGSGFSVASLTDYQCLGVNPANLGWQRNQHKANLGFFETGLSIYSEPLSKRLVYTDLLGSGSDFTSQSERNEAILNFTNTDLLIQVTNNLVGFSYQDEKVGGFGFIVRQKIFWQSTLNEQASEFLFEGYNAAYFDSLTVQQNGDTIGYSTNPYEASRVYNPTDLSHIFYNEYVLGYGRKFVDKENFSLYAGIDLKLIQGFGVLNYNSISVVEVEGYQALAPFYGVKYNEPTPSELTGGGLKTAGMGFGVDLGLTFDIYRNTRVAIALNDIGSVRWDGNVYEGENVPIRSIETSGINNYNIFSESGGIIADNTNLGKWYGLDNKTVSLPMNLRAGASHQPLEELSFGFEMLLPVKQDVPGAYADPYFAGGIRYEPAKWFQLSTGFTAGGGFGFNIPMGLTFRPVNNAQTCWELGFASRDLLTLFKQNNPMVSFVFGFLRFSFGQGS